MPKILTLLTGMLALGVGSSTFTPVAASELPFATRSDCQVSPWASDKACWFALERVSLTLSGTKGAGWHISSNAGVRVSEGKLNGETTVTLNQGDEFFIEDPHNPFGGDNRIHIVSWQRPAE